MEWHTKAPARWRSEQRIAHRLMRHVQTGLDEQGRAFITGVVHVHSQHGAERGPFSIRVVYPSGFPERGRVPSIYLDSHRDLWQNGQDSHIEADWKLCLFVPGESPVDFRRHDSLEALLCCLGAFLLKECIYQRRLLAQVVTGIQARWPGPDRGHGVRGLREALRDAGGLGRNEPCLCGSGLKFKECCMKKLKG